LKFSHASLKYFIIDPILLRSKETALSEHQALKQQILNEIAQMLAHIMQESLADLSIELETSFQQDLELESIEMVALGDLIQDFYEQQGFKLDFASWLTAMTLEQLLNLKVGDLVEWIESQISHR
jgi:acyl carrier protein